MEGQKHPRFLGFLWKAHKYQRLNNLPCKERCIYPGCGKKRHRPHPEDKAINLKQYFGGSYIEERCKICGDVRCHTLGHNNGY